MKLAKLLVYVIGYKYSGGCVVVKQEMKGNARLRRVTVKRLAPIFTDFPCFTCCPALKEVIIICI